MTDQPPKTDASTMGELETEAHADDKPQPEAGAAIHGRNDVVGAPTPYSPLPPEGQSSGPWAALRRIGVAVGGPALIVGSVLILLRHLAFSASFPSRHPDVLSTFLPGYCYLGKALASGHIPAWNPHVMGGVPFAADPLSGWMDLPVMAMFGTLSCGLALRWFIVLQPILAGLGIYAFLRSEGLSRPAATVGGLALGLPIAGSALVLSVPFAGTLAWTALLLAAASRMARAETWPRRLVWLLLTALAWGRLAAAHLSHGFVLGTMALAMYLAARVVADVRSGRRGIRDSGALAGILVLALPLVNAAYFLPRLSYLHRSTLGDGYVRLQTLAAELRHIAPHPFHAGGIRPTQPLQLSEPTGVYLGAIALGLVFAGWTVKRHRHLMVAFSLIGALSYVLALQRVAAFLAPHLEGTSFGSFYLHETDRFAFGVVLALAVLAGVGFEGWRSSTGIARRIVPIVPSLIVWGVLPPLVGLHRTGLLPLFGLLGLGAGLVVAARWPAGAVALPVLLAAEIGVSGFGPPVPASLLPSVAAGSDELAVSSLPTDATASITRPLRPFLSLRDPGYEPASAYVDPGPIALALERAGSGGRYLTIAPDLWRSVGYHVIRGPDSRGLMARQQSMLFGLEEGQGYNSIELARYWRFLRAVDPKAIKYNAAGFKHADPLALDLLQVEDLIQPATDPPAVPGQQAVAHEGQWVLSRIPDPAPRASLITSWQVVDGPDEALQAVLAPEFDPDVTVVLERGHGVPSPPAAGTVGPPPGTATYTRTGEQSARVEVDAAAASILLVRNAFDPNWRALVDGRPAPVLPADSLDQAIPVSAGRHTVLLAYDDPAVGRGLLISLLATLALLGSAGAIVVRAGRRAHGASEAETKGPELGTDVPEAVMEGAEAERARASPPAHMRDGEPSL